MMTKTLATSAALALAASFSAQGAEWGYDGQTGVYTPDQWHYVSDTCGSGEAQSPINIVTRSTHREQLAMALDYDVRKADYFNNGHTVVVDSDRSIKIADVNEFGEPYMHEYDLVQFHFHTLSEHTVNGKRYDMELHFVHADDDGNLAVLGVLVREGRYNAWFRDMFNNLPDAGDGESDMLSARLPFNYERLLPRSRSFFSYEGSLTTPPCSEGVKWLILRQPIQMSSQQIEAFRDLFQEFGEHYHTNRPVQDINGREVVFSRDLRHRHKRHGHRHQQPEETVPEVPEEQPETGGETDPPQPIALPIGSV